MSAHLTPRQLTLTIESDTSQLRSLRTLLRRWLTDLGEPSDDWLLIANELCANAMAVTGNPIEVTMTLTTTELILEVTDDGPGFVPDIIDPGVTSPRQRGLWIVDRLTGRLEITRHGNQTTVTAAREMMHPSTR